MEVAAGRLAQRKMRESLHGKTRQSKRKAKVSCSRGAKGGRLLHSVVFFSADNAPGAFSAPGILILFISHRRQSRIVCGGHDLTCGSGEVEGLAKGVSC